MATPPKVISKDAQVLADAFLKAGEFLGFSSVELMSIIDGDYESISRDGINPETASGDQALLLIRAYKSLFALMGGNHMQMKDWMHTKNLHTGGIPAKQIQDGQGLVQVVKYLEAMSRHV